MKRDGLHEADVVVAIQGVRVTVLLPFWSNEDSTGKDCCASAIPRKSISPRVAPLN